MVEKVQSSKLIGPPSGLRFEVALDLGSGQNAAGLAWGELSLRFDGTPIWCAQTADGNEGPVRWTWIDLLEFLARNWPWLVLEESYPIPVNPSFPGALQRYAEYRWENGGLGDPIIEKEDEEVYRFLCRHDLAVGLQGLYLPSLILMRQGHQVLLSIPELGLDVICPFHEIFDTLSELGEHLAESLAGVAEPRAALACDLWRRRRERLWERAAPLRSGLDPASLAKLAGATPSNAYWELDAAKPEADTELLAAARMSAGVIGIESQRVLLERLGESDTPIIPSWSVSPSACGPTLPRPARPMSRATGLPSGFAPHWV